MAIKQSRNKNLDYLRIFSLWLIVIHHIYLQMAAHFTNWTVGNLPKLVLMTFGSGGKIGVNLFMLITGFFLVRRAFKWERLINLVVRVYVISTFLAVASYILVRPTIMTVLKLWLTPIFPFNWSGWWYVTGYAMVLMISPFINQLFKVMTFKSATLMVLTLLGLASVLPFLNLGTQILPLYATNGGGWMIVMYCCGGYLGMYSHKLRIHPRGWWSLLAAGYLLLIGRFALMIWQPKPMVHLLGALHWYQSSPWTDHDPLLLLISFAMFMLAVTSSSLPMPKVLAILANETLAMYMLHNSNPVSTQYRMELQSMIHGQTWSGRSMVFYELGASVLIFLIVAICAVLLAPLERWAVNKVTPFVKSKIEIFSEPK